MVVASLIAISCQEDSEPSVPFKLEVNAYDEATKSFHLTHATLLISVESQAVLTKELAAETSTISVAARGGSYTVTVTKPDHLPFEKKFTASELSQFNVF